MRTQNLTPSIERSRPILFLKNGEKNLRIFKILKIYFLMNFPEFEYLIFVLFKETFIRSNPPCSEALKIK